MIETRVNLGSYIQKETTLFLNEMGRDDALSALIDALVQEKHISKKEPFLEAILEREKVISTGIGMGIAIPHAKMLNISDFFIGIGIVSKGGIEWNAIDRLPVHFIFLIGGPLAAYKEYLRLLSSLTTVLKDEKTRRNLILQTCAEDVVKIFHA